MNNNQGLIRYGISALIVFIILYHSWFFIMGALAVYGLYSMIQRWSRPR